MYKYRTTIRLEARFTDSQMTFVDCESWSLNNEKGILTLLVHGFQYEYSMEEFKVYILRSYL